MSNDLFDALKKKYEGITFGNRGNYLSVQGSIPTGIINLDLATGVNGIPIGRITQIYGQESSGKSTVALQATAFAQKMGLYVVYVDAENSLDPHYAEILGVNMNNILIAQPDSAEDTMGIVKDSIVNGAGLIVIDSVPALPTRYEADGEIGDAHIGQHARLMSQSSRIWTPALAKNKCAILAINQIRAKIQTFGPPGGNSVPGGHAWKHRVDLNIRFKIIKNDPNYRRIRFKIEKNRIGKPLTEGEYDILHGEGVTLSSQLLDLGIESKILQKKGSWIKNGEETIGQGQSAAEKITQNEELVRKILSSANLSKEMEELYMNGIQKVL